MVTLLLLSTHHPWISWQSTADHTSVTLNSSPIDQLAEYSSSHFCYSPLITRGSAGKHIWSHFCYSPLITRGSPGRAQLVTLLLLSTHHPCVSWQSTLVTLLFLSTHHPWISWQSTAVHTSVSLHSSPVEQLPEYSWSHICHSPLITRGSAGRVQLVTLLFLSTHHLWISWQSTAGHTSVILHSSPVDQLAEHSWSHFCYSPLITRGSVGRAQLVTLLLLSTYHPWISWQSTAGHTSITLHLSPVDQLAEHSWSHFSYSPLITRVSAGRAHWSHFCYSPLITRESAGRAKLFTLLLLSSHHPWISWQSTLVTLLLLSTHHPWISWQSTAVHTSVTLQSSSVDQLAEHSWSHFYYSPLITRGAAGRTQLVTLLLLSTHHPCVSWQSTLVTLLLLSTHHPWISWQSTAGHTSVTLHASPMDQLAEHSWSHFCYSPLITRVSAGRAHW